MATIGPVRNCAAKFDFADHRLSQVARLHQLWRIDRHTRTDHDQVLPTKGAVAVATGFDRDPMLQQQQDFIAKLGLRAWYPTP